MELSVIIPSEDFLFEKPVYCKKKIYTSEDDKSLWMTSIYEFWNVTNIINDISLRILRLDISMIHTMNLSEINSIICPNEIEKIKEGIRMIKERIPSISIYTEIVKNIEQSLLFKLKTVENIKILKKETIEKIKNFVNYKMDLFLQSIYTKTLVIQDIDPIKNEIKKLTVSLKNAGATHDILRNIGKKMKNIYGEISKYIHQYPKL
jgi:hypothetical protein